MPWKSTTTMSERKTFVQLALAKNSNMSTLCERFGISRPTGYKWVRRWTHDGDAGLTDLNRRPHHSPRRTQEPVEAAVVELRHGHRAWGGRMINQVLKDRDVANVPAPSTITGILRRHGLIDPVEAQRHRAWQRFEHASPNDLWQMDFKGHFPLADAVHRCHPLTILDDHSRFSLAIRACAFETHTVVYEALVNVFRQYGMPLCILTDNGPPWGVPGAYPGYTKLSVWLLRLGIYVSHGRPYHPQTQGKEERFHRTFKAEVLYDHHFGSYDDCQHAFDQWREIYNCERPHRSLDMKTPVTRYQISPRIYVETLPPIEYGADDLVRKVQGKGQIYALGKIIAIGKAFRGQPVALRPTTQDGLYDVYYCHQRITQINLNEAKSQTKKV